MLQKQSFPLNFAQGLDLKTDPYQVAFGKFLELANSVFTKGGLLQKRNGFGRLSTLPMPASYLTTFNGDLTAIEENLQAYDPASKTWINQGVLQPLKLSTLALVRNNLNQLQGDSAVAPNGLVCTAYTETVDGTTLTYSFAIADSITGQNVIQPSALPPIAGGVVTGSPRVFVLGNYFVIVYSSTVTATDHLQYYAINYKTYSTMGPTDITAQYTPSDGLAFDGAVGNDRLYLAWNGSDIGGAVHVKYLSTQLVQSSDLIVAGETATLMSVCVDDSGTLANVYVSYYDSNTQDGFAFATDQNIQLLFTPPAQIINSEDVANITATAQDNICTVLYEVINEYSYDTIPTNYLNSVSVSSTGTVGSTVTITRSVGLASKAFLIDGTAYVLATYQSAYQPTYFLLNATDSDEEAPIITAWLANGNGGGYLPTGLPAVSVYNQTLSVLYRVKDLITSVSKETNPTPGTQTAGVYAQTGLNMMTCELTSEDLTSSEIGKNLNIPAGFVWAYDGYQVTEQGFFIWPDDVQATWADTGGSIAAQPDGATNTDVYWYQVLYEFTDNQGNIFRSAPSIPISVTTTGTGSTGAITLDIPTLRLTYKTASPVKICVYRWSIAQQIYYEVTSILEPLLNDMTVDSVQFVDTSSDATILGNAIIYVTGGVLENIAPPPSSAMTLFDNRLWVVDSQDRNLLWYSKQVLQATPVEMSDLQTIYVAPTIGASGSTGPITALGAMDDKLLIWKQDATYYINGRGPDATGSNSQYSEPIYITSVVGCSNQNSIVFIPRGLMFQSNKGIWLLGRDLSTEYIGAPVESLTEGAIVLSAITVPGTNQVRFTLDTGVTLMYDYFFDQWGSFQNVPGIASTIYTNLHTYINDLGQVFRETPGVYLDGSNPVLLSFKTSWINLAGLQGYQRAHFFYLLGTYKTPHTLNLQIAYDYNSSPTQSTPVMPANFSPYYGTPDIGVYGQQSPYGGPDNIEQWRIFLTQQRCKSFQITFNEMYDSSFGVPAGQGLTLSGLNIICSIKKGWNPIPAAQSAGSGGATGGLG